ncbi:DENN domain-containing protein 3-like [Lethenteron reissneri]|uniref:DENN domain-containing protein 3-like n=1 Tax=Lethenteron reissneri TaxID=7753 RepID=UPI002AB7D252|nr:DENN domain-containing protein 3-like [Lethenteron reissneri]
MGPLRVLLPPSDSEVHDLDLTVPFTCLRSHHLLQVLTCLLLEQKLVLLSAEWALLAPVGHSLLAFLAPLCWRHTFVPVLASSMLGFLEAPTVYLMGTHGRHKHAISQVEDLVIVDLDSGQLVPTPASVPGYPPGSAGPPGTPDGQPLTPLIAPPEEAAEAFLSSCRHVCVREEAHALGVATPCSLHELRRAARARRQRLNACIQELFLGFIHRAFREVLAHLDVEQRVFSREEFLESRRPADLPFYRKVLDTDVFDLFLKDRLAQKADSFSRLENKSSSWSQKMKQEMLRSLRRRTTEERARQQPRPTSAHLGEGVTTTHPGEEHDPSSLAFAGPAPPAPPMEPWGPDPWDDGAVFTLPPLPPDPLLPGEGQRYCEGLCVALGAALGQVAPSRWGLRAALHAVRAGARLASRQPELALQDLHSISKMDKSVVPPDEARRILLLLPTWARAQVEERAELRWLLQEEVDEPALPPHAAGPLGPTGSPDGRVRSFALPSAPLSCDELGTCVREAGITCDPATVGRLFGALTNGRGEVLPADAVRRLYEAWRATERAARELSLPVEALARLDSSEIVYKVSPVVLTSLGQGRVAMTQSRLFLLRDGAAVPFVDIAKFSDIEDVQEVSTLGVLRPRLQALRVVSRRHPGAPFVANLKEQHGPWCLAVREMRAGKRLAHALKDAQFVHRALTNVLLMDAVAQCVRRKRAATAAAMLAHCTREDARVSVESGPAGRAGHAGHAGAPGDAGAGQAAGRRRAALRAGRAAARRGGRRGHPPPAVVRSERGPRRRVRRGHLDRGARTPAGRHQETEPPAVRGGLPGVGRLVRPERLHPGGARGRRAGLPPPPGGARRRGHRPPARRRRRPAASGRRPAHRSDLVQRRRPHDHVGRARAGGGAPRPPARLPLAHLRAAPRRRTVVLRGAVRGGGEPGG